MSSQLFQKLEEKINQILEIVEMQRLQLDEALEENQSLISEISGLKVRQAQWEQCLSKLLYKIDAADYNPNDTAERNEMENEMESEMESEMEVEDFETEDLVTR